MILQKKRKEGILSLSPYSHAGRRVGFGCYTAKRGVPTKNLFQLYFIVSPASTAFDSAEGPGISLKLQFKPFV